MNRNWEIKKETRKMRRALKKLGCKVKVAYQLDTDGRYIRIAMDIDYSASESAIASISSYSTSQSGSEEE